MLLDRLSYKLRECQIQSEHECALIVIIQQLVELRQRGVIQGIWVDGWQLRLRFEEYGPLISVPWEEAEWLIEQHKRKGPGSVMITDSREEKQA